MLNNLNIGIVDYLRTLEYGKRMPRHKTAEQKGGIPRVRKLFAVVPEDVYKALKHYAVEHRCGDAGSDRGGITALPENEARR
jgi:hypothetical protein